MSLGFRIKQLQNNLNFPKSTLDLILVLSIVASSIKAICNMIYLIDSNIIFLRLTEMEPEKRKLQLNLIVYTDNYHSYQHMLIV